jgi:glycosyltransferase involved in cell wall biosynthesis
MMLFVSCWLISISASFSHLFQLITLTHRRTEMADMQLLLNPKAAKATIAKKLDRIRGRVAYILDSFPNVSETFISNEINELLRLGWDVQIFSLHRPKPQLVHESAQSLLVRTIYLPQPVPRLSIAASLMTLMTRNLRRTRSTLKASKSMRGKHFAWTARQSVYLAHQVRKANCDRIHVHFASEASRYGIFVSKLLDLPLTVTIHSPMGANESDRDTLFAIGAIADAVITVSEFNKRHISENFNVPASKIFVNPNGILRNTFKIDRGAVRISKRILTVARLHPDKGLRHAIGAAKILHDAKLDFEWIIIGDGPERPSLEGQIKSLGLGDKMRLLGFQPATRVLKELQLASLFVLPSISESQGVVYLEAMATGTPIIGTNIPGVDETVINGESGILVPVASPEDLAQAVMHLLEDKELCKRLSDNALLRVDEHYLLPERIEALTGIWKSGNALSQV